ncbi:putative signal transducing protein [Mucilaginibacter myungsuensis]|uniref:DUF2007 domain-containing protein n=1 Tax=Mucilaginibacter myungsuensis TaxID=649104 RepID=A0A929KSC9_9SPHI|nr:DUF2007 domain-containing protein [Mucilaginibacter myungsuensis]MBE9660282.1 DUF2007 domain-containing protein [Mucilaginibacter myungsuensis]MDN3600324.1 DUF2007 domain-containing protein [Mucilaginibacter myungsuensis]
MNEQENIITLETFYDAGLAHITQTRLADAGIESFIDDQNTIGANPFYNQAIGGLKLRIFESDLEKSKAILAEDVSLPDNFDPTDQ